MCEKYSIFLIRLMKTIKYLSYLIFLLKNVQAHYILMTIPSYDYVGCLAK